MAGFCRLSPREGIELFNNLKSKFGYDTAWRVHSLTTLPDFQKGRTFRKDSEGFPLMEDLLKDDVVKQIIGKETLYKGLEKNFKVLEDTRANYSILLEQANNFNNDKNNSDYIATIDYTEDGNLKVVIEDRTIESEKRAMNQYSVESLNKKLASLLSDAGITIDNLEEAELAAGRIGVVDFVNAYNIADSSINVIRVANNKEGSRAISEEFSHLLIGSYRDNPLVKRALNALNNEELLKIILGDEYQSVYDFQDGNLELVAEEALGKLLRDNLLAESSNNPEVISSLLDRLYASIKRKFKGIDAKEIEKAVIEANSSMGQLAKNILTKRMEIKQSKIKLAAREAQFNALSDRIDTNIDILKDIRDIEIKRLKISPNKSAKEIANQKKLIVKLSVLTEGEKDTRIGIYNYAKNAIEELSKINKGLARNTVLGHPSFAALRNARAYVLSYADFIVAMKAAMIKAEKDEEVPNYLTDIELEDGTIVDMGDIIKDLNDISETVLARYHEYVKPMLIEFFRPFYNNEIATVINGEKKTITLEGIIEESASDISFLDLFLNSMADSDSPYLQLFNSAVLKANDLAREQTIKDSREVYRLIKFADEHGIKDFDWIYERDSQGNRTGNYIGRIDFAKFKEERDKERARLEDKYGKRATGENARLKIKEYKKWLKENTDPEDNNMPKDIDKYLNKTFLNLSPEYREFYDEFMRLKIEADIKYPDSRVAANKAIQMRKSSGNRIIESLSNPKSLIANIKEDIKQTFLAAEDDDSIYGGNRTGLRNFDGTEYMTLPVIYTTRIKNPNELTNDIFAALISYQFAANTYEAMDRVVDPLEVARTWVADKSFKVQESIGNKPLVEKLKGQGETIINKIYKGNTNIERKLNEFLESGVYQRYIKDEGTLFGTNLSKSKTANWLMHITSYSKLAFNWLSQMANLTTGIAMINIEAAAGEYFNAKELFDADKTYAALLPSLMSEFGSRTKTNKLSLFDELFNVKIDFKQRVRDNKLRSILQKMFGETIAYLGQEGGDHWLYNRVAIAYCKHMRVLVPKVTKYVPKIKGLEAALEVKERMLKDAEAMRLAENEKHYINDLNNKEYARVTSLVNMQLGEDGFKEFHDDGSPNNWILPSTKIGNGNDELIRDFFDNKLLQTDDGEWHHNDLGDNLTSIYPNMSKEDLYAFLEELKDLKTQFDNKGLTVVSRNIVAKGKINVNNGGKLMSLDVAGTLDLLVHDNNGNFYIYDMKSHRGKITSEKKHKWSLQLSLYKKFLEEEYGITVKGLYIIPTKVSYPIPEGEAAGEYEGISKYSVKEGTANQLLIDGKEFKGSKPKLEDIIELSESKLNLEYNDLGYNKSLATPYNNSDYEEMSLWDALEIVNTYEDRDDIKEMILPEGTIDSYGNEVSVKQISREIQDVNIHLFGAYDQENANVANRVAVGRMIQQCRKWIVPQYNKRFAKSQINVLTGKRREGYYRTFSKYYANKFIETLNLEILRGRFQIASNWNELDDTEKANIRRAWTEILQSLAVYLLVTFAPFPDDRNRSKALKRLELALRRANHELLSLTPSTAMVNEVLKTLQSPALILSSMGDISNLLSSIITPADWIDEKQSGPYKGMSTLETNLIKAPIPIIAPYLQMEKFNGGLDNSISYYLRPR